MPQAIPRNQDSTWRSLSAKICTKVHPLKDLRLTIDTVHSSCPFTVLDSDSMAPYALAMIIACSCSSTQHCCARCDGKVKTKSQGSLQDAVGTLAQSEGHSLGTFCTSEGKNFHSPAEMPLLQSQMPRLNGSKSTARSWPHFFNY